MPENVFVKFKNLLRGVRSDYKEFLDEAKTEELIATDKLKEIIKKAKKEGHKSIEADGKIIGDIFSVNPSEENRKCKFLIHKLQRWIKNLHCVFQYLIE